MSDESGIYQIRNQIDGTVYIGSACNLEVRWKAHQRSLRRNYHPNIHLTRAWRRDGHQAFVFEVLELVVDLTELIAAEQRWIDAALKRYNIAPKAGSSLGRAVSAETRLRISRANKGKTLGRVTSEETKEKLRVINKNRPPMPQAQRAKISAARKGKPSHGKPHTVETKKLLSELAKRRTGTANSFYGKTHTEEACRKNAATKIGHYRIYPPDAEPFEISNMRAFCLERGLNAGEMTKTARGEARQHKGWRAERLAI
jgi:group I intron endonuclease